jgi:hypothetical protein
MNREVVGGAGAAIYPLIGDVSSKAGNNRVSVTGLQGIPISSDIPQQGDYLVYNINNNNWEPYFNATILVNGLIVSDDWTVNVNQSAPFKVNGVPV